MFNFQSRDLPGNIQTSGLITENMIQLINVIQVRRGGTQILQAIIIHSILLLLNLQAVHIVINTADSS